ncbi:MAG: hypothetical protein JEZ11_22905 [Desulfobacterales bacterium]|nr:hypothetical protein [Desulfobacterales bacterium]
MNFFRLSGLIIAVLLSSVCLPATAGADPSAVRLAVPAEAKPGSIITVRVFVTHEGNNFFHFTDWVFVAVGETEIGRWEFAADRRPEDENFTREITYTVQGATTFHAQAHCNIHGSAGPAEATVRTPALTVSAAAPPSAVGGETGRSGPTPPASGGRRGLGLVVLALGIVNLLLAGFQVASGRRWIPVKIPVHRRTGQLLAVLALIHGLLAIFLNS